MIAHSASSRSGRLFAYVFFIIIGVSLACSVSGAPQATLNVLLQTPTAAPVASAPPTALLPSGAAFSRPIDPGVHDLLDMVQSDRLMVAVGTLADFRSRHVLSR